MPRRPRTHDAPASPPRGRRRRATIAGLAVGALTAGMLAVAAAPSQAAAPVLTPDPYGNLAQALQESLYFYDAEMSGPSRTAGVQRLEWRGDSEPTDSAVPLTAGGTGTDGLANVGTNLPASFIAQYKDILDPDGNGTLDLSGGYHDAGDHVKFGLPQAYSAATLGWGLLEYKDAYVKTGSYDAIMTHLRWFTDYFLRSTFRDANGTVIAFNYMVGRGGVDHTYWGAPELQDGTKFPRPATFAYAGAPASDQAAQTAAALTVMALNTKASDPTYSSTCLDTAKALYAFAKANRGTGNGDGFYPSSYDDDEMAWAAAWLYDATKTASYLNDIVGQDANGTYTGYLKKIVGNSTDQWQNIWVHSWDTVWGGVFAKLAPMTKGVVPDTENQKYWYYFRWNAEYWTGGAVKHRNNANDTTYIAASPAGYSVVASWGSARYNTAAQLTALIYRKYSAMDWGTAAENEAEGVALSQWALSQMNYLMGDNPLKRSYVVGFTASSTDTSVQHPHHRAAHGSSTNSMLVPATHRHTLWGALAGGPDLADAHKDETTDYVYNEVAIDYNAGFVGALAGLYSYFGSGQTVTTWTPPAEAAETPFIAKAKLEQENNQRTQVTLQVSNTVTHPPALVDDLSMRYYFDISEMLAKGQTIADVKVETYYDQAKTLGEGTTAISAPVAVDAAKGLYYVTVSWDGIAFYGTRDVQFGLIAGMDSAWGNNWDPSNDYSHTGISSTTLTESTYVPVYRNGVLVHGTEPTSGPVVPDTTAPTTPGTPVASGITASGATLTWAASTDAGGLAGYQVSTVVGTTRTLVGSSTSASYTLTGLSASTAYSYSVVAKDLSGNVSAASPTVTFTTLGGTTTPPPTPTGLAAVDIGTTGFYLTWVAPTDTTAYTGYDVYQGTKKIASPTTNSYLVTGLAPATTYSFTVVTHDAAGNQSTPSAALSVTTQRSSTTSGCNVAYAAPSWGTGFTGSIKITNTGTAAWTGWTLAFTFPSGQKVDQGWSATWAQVGADVTATNAAWNGALAPGASTTIGFNGSYTGTNTAPTGFTVNGETCSTS